MTAGTISTAPASFAGAFLSTALARPLHLTPHYSARHSVTPHYSARHSVTPHYSSHDSPLTTYSIPPNSSLRSSPLTHSLTHYSLATHYSSTTHPPLIHHSSTTHPPLIHHSSTTHPPIFTWVRFSTPHASTADGSLAPRSGTLPQAARMALWVAIGISRGAVPSRRDLTSVRYSRALLHHLLDRGAQIQAVAWAEGRTASMWPHQAQVAGTAAVWLLMAGTTAQP